MAGKIFVNYRREDDPGFVHAIFQRLEAEFGREQLFMDVEGYINAGDDFVSILDGQVAECAVLLVVIGPRWLEIRDQAGHRRLDNEDDFVRVEIASGLRREKRVIPVLVNNARMPSRALLPDELRPLARRHAVRLSHERFVSDCQGLAREIRGALANAKAPQPTTDLSRMRPQKPGKGRVSSHTTVAGAGSPRLAQLGKHPPQPGPEAIKEAIVRIQEASQAPRLAPPEYRVLFEIMAKELTDNDLTGAQTLTNIMQRARERRLDVQRDDVRFVLEVVSEADPWFEQGISASLFAGRFRNFVVARCRSKGLIISGDELDLIDAWFASGGLTEAPLG